LPGSKHLTDYFLLALAVKHGGRFATFDTGIHAALVPGGQAVLHVLPTT
jgi:predicted nucleic acid-binding protein